MTGDFDTVHDLRLGGAVVFRCNRRQNRRSLWLLEGVTESEPEAVPLVFELIRLELAEGWDVTLAFSGEYWTGGEWAGQHTAGGNSH